MNNPLGKGGCGGGAGKKSDRLHSDEIDGSWLSVRAGAGEYTEGHSNFAFALRNSITGIQSPDTEKFSSILVFEEGYNLTTFSIYCGNYITYRTISNPYISPIHDKVRELTLGGVTKQLGANLIQ